MGEPDFPTPEHVVEAAHQAARIGFTRYAPNAWLPELREVLVAKIARRNGYEARVLSYAFSCHYASSCCRPLVHQRDTAALRFSSIGGPKFLSARRSSNVIYCSRR